MKLRSFFGIFFLLFPGWLAAQPVVNALGVVNSATYIDPGLPNGAIAEGSLFTIFGTGLGGATPANASGFPIPVSLGATVVNLADSIGVTQLPLLFASANQVTALMPSGIPAGTMSLSVSYNGQQSNLVNVQIVASSFGIYTLNAQGFGAGVFTNSDYQVYSPTSAALAGDVVTMWGTGLGPVGGDDSGGPLPGNLASVPVQV